MEKVYLTVEQVENIKELISYDCPLGTYRDNSDYYDALRSLPIDFIARAIYVGYEIIPMFKVGDIVVNSVSLDTGEVTRVFDNGFIAIMGGSSGHYDPQFFRHATMEETVRHRRSMWWKAMGRKDMEFREGDVVELADCKRVGYVTGTLIIGDSMSIATAQGLLLKNHIIAVYPVDERRYVPQSDWEWDN